jgi:hypothetical protein
MHAVYIEASRGAVEVRQHHQPLWALLEGGGESSHDERVIITIPIRLAPFEWRFNVDLEKYRHVVRKVEENF